MNVVCFNYEAMENSYISTDHWDRDCFADFSFMQQLDI